MSPDSKLTIAKQLDELGVNSIEAGFAASSKGELNSIKKIAQENLKATVYSHARGVIKDIDAVIQSEADAVFLVVPSSDLHLTSKIKKTRQEALQITEECVQYAKDHGLTVEFGAEDSTRSDFSYLKQMISVALSAGADKISPCDTVGILTPEKAYTFFLDLTSEFPNVSFSTHCHDDFGMAVANSIMSLKGGAKEVHATINGLGERAGNAALEELGVTLKLLYNVETSIKLNLLYETSLLVSRLTRIPVQPNKAIVGENAFLHESGIHTHALLNQPLTYEPISPEIVGRTRRFVTGKHSGKRGLLATLNEIGLYPTDDQLHKIFRKIKMLGDKSKIITDADLHALAEITMGLPRNPSINLEELTVVTGNKVTPTASIKLNLKNTLLVEAATGIGPVDAAINAIRKALSVVEPITLEKYHVNAITGGTDALVEVIVSLRKGKKTTTALGAHEDIVMASVKAMISGMDVLLSSDTRQKRDRRSPQSSHLKIKKDNKKR